MTIKERKKEKKITAYSMAFMAFSAVWGFGNVVNGYRYYNGMGVVSMWILMFAIYFIPYALMVGELGSAFKNEGGGVSSWIDRTMGKRLAFYAGWTYWVVHIPYLAQKPTTSIVALGWIIFGDGRVGEESWKIFNSGILSQIPTATVIQLLGLIVFFLTVLMALRGVTFLKKISSIAGTAMFVMSILFIIMMIAAPGINGKVSWTEINWSWRTFLPEFNINTIMNIAILIFAVGGCEKLSPYVNKMDNPSKSFPKGMILLAVMVAVCAILGTVAMGLMFSGHPLDNEFVTNGQYLAFQMVGQYYGLGSSLMIIYAICILIVQEAVMIVSIDAPLRMLLDNSTSEYIPGWLTKTNKRGVYKNGVLVVSIAVSVLIVVPALGIGSVSDIVDFIIGLNSICMPLRYLWVFVAYIALKKYSERFPSEYHFTKKKGFGIFIGIWCFAITAFACITKIFNTGGDYFKLVMNILTPFILLGIGLVLPVIAKRTNKEYNR